MRCFNYLLFLIILAGFPATTTSSGMSCVTTEPAPTMTRFPMVTPRQTISLLDACLYLRIRIVVRLVMDHFFVFRHCLSVNLSILSPKGTIVSQLTVWGCHQSINPSIHHSINQKIECKGSIFFWDMQKKEGLFSKKQVKAKNCHKNFIKCLRSYAKKAVLLQRNVNLSGIHLYKSLTICAEKRAKRSLYGSFLFQ